MSTHDEGVQTKAPKHSAAGGIATLAAFSSLITLLAWDAPLPWLLIVMVLAGALGAAWSPQMSNETDPRQRRLTAFVLVTVLLGGTATIVSPLSWPWATGYGVLSFVILLALVRRVD